MQCSGAEAGASVQEAQDPNPKHCALLSRCRCGLMQGSTLRFKPVAEPKRAQPSTTHSLWRKYLRERGQAKGRKAVTGRQPMLMPRTTPWHRKPHSCANCIAAQLCDPHVAAHCLHLPSLQLIPSSAIPAQPPCIWPCHSVGTSNLNCLNCSAAATSCTLTMRMDASYVAWVRGASQIEPQSH